MFYANCISILSLFSYSLGIINIVFFLVMIILFVYMQKYSSNPINSKEWTNTSDSINDKEKFSIASLFIHSIYLFSYFEYIYDCIQYLLSDDTQYKLYRFQTSNCYCLQIIDYNVHVLWVHLLQNVYYQENIYQQDSCLYSEYVI